MPQRRVWSVMVGTWLLLSLPAVAGTRDISVSGTINDPAATVTVNTKPATVTSDGHWSVTITLKEGANTITAMATDRAGNEGAPHAITVTLDTVGPVIHIDSPHDGDVLGTS